MSSSPRYRLSSSVAATQVDENTTVVLHLASQTYFQLNRTGTRLWSCIEERGEATRADLVDVLHAEQETVSRGEVRADVDAFLDNLRSARLLEVEEPGSSQTVEHAS